jgi:CelD/BcsL family acetyltransferase involved in cellulose biosynthesis
LQVLDRAELERHVADYDACVAADPEVDRFCTRSDWILPFHDAFHPRDEVIAARGDGAFVVLQSRGPLLAPLEAMWSFPSPLVGDGSVELLLELLRSLAPPPGLVHLAGLAPATARTESLVRALARTHALAHASTTVRCVARLDDVEGFLARRSAKLRATLRTALRRVRAAGVGFAALEVSSPRDAESAYERVLAVERRSWKAATDNGVDRGPMREFYARMLPRLAARGALRILLASRDGEDVGYLTGGLAGTTFRGLQFSFDERFRSLGLGNALQLEMIARLSRDGVTNYDLGSESAYKLRWAEQRVATIGLLARRRE